MQPFLVALKMHCQPRLVCAVNLLGEKTSASLRRVKQQSLKKDTLAHTERNMEQQLLVLHLFILI